MVFSTEGFFEVAIESWPEWDLSLRPLNSVQALQPTELLDYIYIYIYIYIKIYFSYQYRFRKGFSTQHYLEKWEFCTNKGLCLYLMIYR